MVMPPSGDQDRDHLPDDSDTLEKKDKSKHVRCQSGPIPASLAAVDQGRVCALSFLAAA